MSDPLSALRDDYDRTWERLSRLESENAALKKMIGEWANEMEPREDETSGDYAWRMGVLNLKMREAAK